MAKKTTKTGRLLKKISRERRKKRAANKPKAWTPSDTQRKGLDIVNAAGKAGIAPSEFAKKMWPTSDGWKKESKCGSGHKTKGGAMNITAGAFLGKMARSGAVKVISKPGAKPKLYAITAIGTKALR